MGKEQKGKKASRSKEKSEKEENIPKDVNVVREYIEALLIAIVLALFIRAFVVQAFKIPSGSMEPTLLVGDHLLVNKFIYGIKNPFTGNPIIDFKSPERGDIIVFKYPENPEIDFIKRVVAVAGDTVYMMNKQLYVNHLPVIEDFTVFRGDPEDDPMRDNFDPRVVPENSVFCLGDNRDKSHDGRFWGFVDLKLVRGKAFILYFSWNSKSDTVLGKVRWNRFGKLLHD